MHTARERRGRVRRSAAAAAVLAILGTLVPVGQAVAAASGISTVDGVEEAVDTTVTYDFDCDNQGDPLPPIYRLWGPNNLYHYVVIDDYVHQGSTTSGFFTIAYDDYATGSYSLLVQCGGLPDNGVTRNFTLGSTQAETSTSLGVSATTVVTGDTVTLTATVDGAESGDVTFLAGGAPIGTRALQGGTASLTYQVDEAQTFTARFEGTETAATSTSAPTSVEVVSAITPGTVAIATNPAVGVEQSASVGTWAPEGVTLSYSWTVDGHQVGTQPTYTPTAADQGKALRVVVTGTRAPLTAVPQTSAPKTVELGTIENGYLELDGRDGNNAVLGQTLTPRPVGYGQDAQFSYEWVIGDHERTVTAPTYTPTAADLGKLIQVRMTVTAPGKQPTGDWAYAWPAVTTPTVAVGSQTVTVGRDVVVPVTVAGPQGGPTPKGSVEVTLTPKGSATGQPLDAVVLDGKGRASVPLTGLAVGSYTVSVTYVPTPGSMPVFAVASIAVETNPYTGATGSGTVTVTKVTPTVTVPATVAVPVATEVTLEARVGGAVLPSTFVFREGATVIGQGQLATDGVIPASLGVLAPGTHTVVLELPETASTRAASATFTVTVGGEPARVGALPTAVLDTPEAATAPGQQMELVAEGFEPGETVAFYLHSDPVFLGTAVADENGVARLLADIPADVPAGAHTVIATGGTSGRWATLAVELAVPAAAAPVAAAAPSGDLAATGAQAGLLMAGAWTLLLAGGALVVVARRVRTAR